MPEPTPTTDDPKVDDYGYEITDPEKKPQEDPKEPESKPQEDPKPEDDKTSTGYTEENEPDPETKTGYESDPGEEKDPEPEVEETDEEKKQEAKRKEDVEKAVEGLPESFDKKRVAEFALEHKLTKEQVEAYTKWAKEDQELLQRTQASQIKTQRQSWYKELKEDKDFGGENSKNFTKNLHEVDKLMDKHMPELKKDLTERKGMLPPNIMKGLLRISKMLDPKTELVDGEPGVPKVKEKDFLDEMYE